MDIEKRKAVVIMVGKVKNFFDDFTFHARVMPVLVLFLPILVLGVYNSVLLDSVAENIVLIGILVIFLTIAAKIAREQGKRFESKLYQELGAKPTTIMLRYSDNTIDAITKTRYHNALNNAIENLNLPLKEDDEDAASDELYSSAVNWLRTYANNNPDKEPRVYQELKEYNFWRNLYGIRVLGTSIYLFLCVREIVIMETFNVKHVFLNPYPQYIALIIMILSIVLLCLFATKTTVKNKAFDYAKALIEVSERISRLSGNHN